MMQDDPRYHSSQAYVYVGGHAFTLDELWSGVDRLERRGELARRDRARAQPGLGDERDCPRATRAEAAVIAPLPRPPTIASAGEYEQWLAENPAPDLQAFVRQHGDWRRLPPDVWASFTPQDQEKIKANGSYCAVTPAKWAMWDQRMADWQARRRLRSGSAP
jgi:hypothetical protein